MEHFSYISFDFQGRIKRRTWLLFSLIIAVAGYFTELLVRRAFGLPDTQNLPGSPFLWDYLGDQTSLLSALIFLWPSLAIDVKRWHDLGRSGWNTLIIYVPSLLLFALAAMGQGGTTAHPDPLIAVLLYFFGLILLGYFIVLAARKGMPAANRFGPPPS